MFDLTLVRNVQDGIDEMHCLEILYKENLKLILVIGLDNKIRSYEIDDYLQEAFFVLQTTCKKYKWDYPFVSYLRLNLQQCTYRMKMNFRYPFKVRESIKDCLPTVVRHFDTVASNPFEDKVDTTECLRSAIQQLDDDAKDILYLYFAKDKTLREIGVRYGITAAGVHKRLKQYLSKLRDIVDEK